MAARAIQVTINKVEAALMGRGIQERKDERARKKSVQELAHENLSRSS
jgi:hypothetical protein